MDIRDQVWHLATKADLRDTAKDILTTLVGLAQPDGMVTISQRELARRTGWSRSLVWARLHELENLGWLKATRPARTPTTFKLLIPGGA